MKTLRSSATLLLAAALSSAAPVPSSALREARLKVEAAYRASNAGSYETGRAVLGRGYSAEETRAILERMFLWLAGPEGRHAGRGAEERVLLELAARGAHPEIGDGANQRSASRWAQYVLVSAPASASGFVTSNRTP